ncbi:phosphotransferase [Ruegeria pomeroyi]|nr:phosphotransferase [Ruegeria pomeroyi]MCE8524286.1 phosphotransferase [Ruegeria pomeroyi]MCE8528190.1 phosphotransferase [Ruegeria pomeroyi]
MMVKPLHEFDCSELGSYLAAHVEGFGALDDIERFGGGQSNPTYKITSGARTFVLRAKPPGKLLASAHQIDREYRVLRALSDTPVPVPQVYYLSGEASPLGTMFYVMEMLDGQIFWDPALPKLARDRRGGVYTQLTRTLAALHDVAPTQMGLRDFGAPGDYFARQLARWTKQYRASTDAENPLIKQLIEWLAAHQPEDDGQVSIVHGDFRIDNLVFSKDASRVIGILDWELSTLGHPIADLAYFCMCLRLPQSGLVKGLGSANRDDFGLPTEESIVAQYCVQRGIEPPAFWTFALAFSFFRLIAIATGVLKRAQQGNASNPRGEAETRRAIETLTKLAGEVIAG